MNMIVVEESPAFPRIKVNDFEQTMADAKWAPAMAKGKQT